MVFNLRSALLICPHLSVVFVPILCATELHYCPETINTKMNTNIAVGFNSTPSPGIKCLLSSATDSIHKWNQSETPLNTHPCLLKLDILLFFFVMKNKKDKMSWKSVFLCSVGPFQTTEPSVWKGLTVQTPRWFIWMCPKHQGLGYSCSLTKRSRPFSNTTTNVTDVPCFSTMQTAHVIPEVSACCTGPH